jgi:mannose-6-phosphate isomerase-like protein (cupin superfamily)
LQTEYSDSAELLRRSVPQDDMAENMELKFQQFKLNEKFAPLYAMEFRDYVDFEVVRAYFMDKPSKDTGSHCHFEEKEFFVVLQGACTAVIDRGNGLEEIRLEGPVDAIYVGAYVWHHFKDFSKDTILMAFSSTNYSSERSDYLTDYEEYKKIIKQ